MYREITLCAASFDLTPFLVIFDCKKFPLGVYFFKSRDVPKDSGKRLLKHRCTCHNRQKHALIIFAYLHSLPEEGDNSLTTFKSRDLFETLFFLDHQTVGYDG